MSVARCMREVSSAEFTGWTAYHRISPLGGLAGEVQAAVIAQQIDMLVQFKVSNRARPRPLTDFMPFQKAPPEDMTPEQMFSNFTMATGTNPAAPGSPGAPGDA